MNTQPAQQRIDEVGKFYVPVARMDKVTGALFWTIASISLLMPYATYGLGEPKHSILKCVFIVLVLAHFLLSQTLRFYLVPSAERMRRKQLLSDAFGTRLSHDRTSHYYNNDYSPSIKRLGANTMENALYSKEIAAKMLITKRLKVGIYLLLWVLAFALRHNNLELLTWITQLVFSGEIVAGWLTLEILRFRHERTFDQLHAHFLHDIGDDAPQAVANVLDAFVAYESAKSSAGILLSSKIFHKLNPSLINKWEQIKTDLGMSFQRGAGMDERAASLQFHK
jgi:hypothetical protein